MRAVGFAEVRKSFGSVTALDGLSLDIPQGGIHTLLGRNGAGKTTALRCLLGLASVDSGSCELLGARSPQELDTVLPRVGVLLESPRFYERFRARRHLKILAKVAGIPNSRVDEMLYFVGLADRAKSLISTYSLGMRQRLALAGALLKDPDLIIADEPTNGLDAAGISDFRKLMRKVADQGRTVIFCTHQMAEAEQVSDTVSVIHQGKQVLTGPTRSVLQESSKGQVRLSLQDPQRAAEVLTAAGFAVEPRDDSLLVEAQDSETLLSVLAKESIFPSEVRLERSSLEELFLSITSDEVGKE